MRIQILALLATFAFTLFGCSNTDPQTPTGNNAERLKGELVGWVELYDLRGEKMNDFGGVVVKLVGTNHTATSAANGRWSIANIPAGTYEVSFERSDLSEKREFGYQFVGGGSAQFGRTTISMKPVARVTSFTMTPDSTVQSIHIDTVRNRRDTVWFRGDFVWRGAFDAVTAGDTAVVVSLYFNTSPNVSNLPSEHVGMVDMAFVSTARPQYSIQRHLLQWGIGSPPGTRLFVRAYVVNHFRTWMIDTTTYGSIITSVGPASPVIEMIMP